jgi:hypothetical protein
MSELEVMMSKATVFCFTLYFDRGIGDDLVNIMYTLHTITTVLTAIFDKNTYETQA